MGRGKTGCTDDSYAEVTLAAPLLNLSTEFSWKETGSDEAALPGVTP
jgi:hypothetical protein